MTYDIHSFHGSMHHGCTVGRVEQIPNHWKPHLVPWSPETWHQSWKLKQYKYFVVQWTSFHDTTKRTPMLLDDDTTQPCIKDPPIFGSSNYNFVPNYWHFRKLPRTINFIYILLKDMTKKTYIIDELESQNDYLIHRTNNFLLSHTYLCVTMTMYGIKKKICTFISWLRYKSPIIKQW